jgi:23S rRNA (cytidine2498-2'-O)-methyltransferase
MSLVAKGLLLYCRPGFETECAAEAKALADNAGLPGRAESTTNSGFVRFHLRDGLPWADVAKRLPYTHWVFARQRVVWIDSIEGLPDADRVSPIAARVAALQLRVGRVWGEHADTNEAKQLSGFLRRVSPYFDKALGKQGSILTREDAPTLHLFFHDHSRVDLGLSYPDDASPWPLGIARLRMPRAAPSRSTLKLAEAFMVLLSEEERERHLRAGLKAVDLGAAPGGWSLQFAERGLRVTAIDNGPLAESVLATGMVEHIRADGFTWKPAKRVDWMVCDMVEQPARVAALIAEWVASGRCRHSIFNLKLPMKKRFAEVQHCSEIIAARMRQTGEPWVLRMRHLYHDREEITCYLGPRK